MSNKFISIQDAAELSHKSIQTIRRAIKAKKLKVKKQKTPQGFNYLINQDSLCTLYKFTIKDSVPEKAIPKSKKGFKVPKKAKNISVDNEDFRSLTRALEAMVAQHSEERQNFLRLMNTLQEKIFVLENQLNLLKEAPKKRWYQVWK